MKYGLEFRYTFNFQNAILKGSKTIYDIAVWLLNSYTLVD